jgi:pre-mRNA branch site protein p14
MSSSRTIKLAPEVNRALFVRNLPFKISSEEIFGLFGKYGPIRQVRLGNKTGTKGTAFVIYEDIFDAKNACEHLSGFNFGGRYLIVLYYQPARAMKKLELQKKEEELNELKQKFQVDDEKS